MNPPSLMNNVLKGCSALALAFAVSHVGQANAATIAWDSAYNISGVSDVSTQGTVLQAINLGTASFAPATVINGVSFESTNAAGALQTRTVGGGAGFLTISTSSSAGTYSYQEYGYPAVPYQNIATEYQAMLTTAYYTGERGDTVTMTLNDLTIGQDYRVAFWVNDSRQAGIGNTQTFTAGNSVTASYNTQGIEGGLGQYVVGLFTADGATQEIVLTANINQATGFNSYPQLNGYQLTAVPEPASIVLLSASAVVVGIALRRRK